MSKLNISNRELLWEIPWVEIHMRMIDFPYYEPPKPNGESEDIIPEKDKNLTKGQMLDRFFDSF